MLVSRLVSRFQQDTSPIHLCPYTTFDRNSIRGPFLRTQPIEGEYAYVYLDGIVLKRSWGGEVKNVSVLAAIGVDQKTHR